MEGAASELTKQLDALFASREHPINAERGLSRLLTALFKLDGYDVRPGEQDSVRGFDLVATRAGAGKHGPATLGIEHKHYPSGRALGSPEIRQLLGAALLSGLDRVMYVSTTGFTRDAKAIVARELPVVVELLDLADLTEWIRRTTAKTHDDTPRIQDLVRAMSRRFAEIIARDPEQLDHLEWRDLERMVAEVFAGLGFVATLTPSSKDGGKDVILECLVGGSAHTYIIEVKHWRSSTRVGAKALTNFLEVIARERREGGLFLSTYGYCDNAFSAISEIDRHRLRFGNKTKIVGLCNTYTKAQSGIWSPPESLVELLFEDTE